MAQRQVIRLRSEDNRFQHAEVLKRNRAKRTRYREFLVEGVKPINLLLRGKWPVRSLWYSWEQPLSGWARHVLASSSAPQHYELPARMMAKLSGKEETSELVAVAGMRAASLSDLQVGAGSPVVVFDRPASPGNLGSAIRSSDALGAAALVYSGHAVDPYDPQTIRASLGSLFSLPILQVGGPIDLARWIETLPARPLVVGSDSAGQVPLQEVDLARPLVLLVGNEARGLSHAYRELCDVVASIPMTGAVDSINVACAASILLYEVARQSRLRRDQLIAGDRERPASDPRLRRTR